MGDRVQVGRFTWFHLSVRFLTWGVWREYCGRRFLLGGRWRHDLRWGQSSHRVGFDLSVRQRSPEQAESLPAPIKPRATRSSATTFGLPHGPVCLAVPILATGPSFQRGAVVSGDVPPYAIMAGNPAQVVRYRFSKTTVERLQRLKWWDWPNDKIRANVEWFYPPIQESLDHFETNP